jgi:diamine N-acetyltransferase
MAMTDNQVIARGSKSQIRLFNREHVDRWMEWPQVLDPLYSSSYPRYMNKFERDAWYYERTNRTDYMMFACEDDRENLMGLLTLRNIDRYRTHAVLGLTMRPENISQGYGTDSLWAFLNYFFETMRFDAMLLDVAAYNRRAQRVYEKCGFVYTGEHWGYYDDYSVFTNDYYRTIRSYFRRHGAWVETLFYDMVLRRYDYYRRRQLGLGPIIR